MPRYDVIVVGVGGMGSAAIYHLARRGRKVLGLERFDIPNQMGSSHGITRIIRLAYFEHPSYVPLLQRAYVLWRELQEQVGEQLLHITGSVDVGLPDGRVISGSRRSCEQHGLAHTVLTSAELHQRFPGYQLPPDMLAVFQPDGGFLLPERCIVAHVMAAQALGAEVHGRERVLDWEPITDGVRVRTERETYKAERLVISAGAWAGTLVDPLAGLTQPERQVLGWFQPRTPDHFAVGRFPVFNMEVEEGHYYGFPVFSVPGFKLGQYHHLREAVVPDELDRECYPRDEVVLRRCVERYFPEAAGPTMAMQVCLFTNTPDEHFLIDGHPGEPRVTFAAGFSGHGFKFCSVVGEILADLASVGATRHDISLFRLRRFNQERSAGQ